MSTCEILVFFPMIWPWNWISWWCGVECAATGLFRSLVFVLSEWLCWRCSLLWRSNYQPQLQLSRIDGLFERPGISFAQCSIDEEFLEIALLRPSSAVQCLTRLNTTMRMINLKECWTPTPTLSVMRSEVNWAIGRYAVRTRTGCLNRMISLILELMVTTRQALIRCATHLSGRIDETRVRLTGIYCRLYMLCE